MASSLHDTVFALSRSLSIPPPPPPASTPPPTCTLARLHYLSMSWILEMHRLQSWRYCWLSLPVRLVILIILVYFFVACFELKFFGSFSPRVTCLLGRHIYYNRIWSLVYNI